MLGRNSIFAANQWSLESRNAQYGENEQDICILKANYYLKVHIVHFKFALCTG